MAGEYQSARCSTGADLENYCARKILATCTPGAHLSKTTPILIAWSCILLRIELEQARQQVQNLWLHHNLPEYKNLSTTTVANNLKHFASMHYYSLYLICLARHISSTAFQIPWLWPYGEVTTPEPPSLDPPMQYKCNIENWISFFFLYDNFWLSAKIVTRGWCE